MANVHICKDDNSNIEHVSGADLRVGDVILIDHTRCTVRKIYVNCLINFIAVPDDANSTVVFIKNDVMYIKLRQPNRQEQLLNLSALTIGDFVYLTLRDVPEEEFLAVYCGNKSNREVGATNKCFKRLDNMKMEELQPSQIHSIRAVNIQSIAGHIVFEEQ